MRASTSTRPRRRLAVAGIVAALAVVLMGCMPKGSTERVSVGSAGEQASGNSGVSQVSGNGRFVVFGSGAPGLAPVAVEHAGVFVRDRLSGSTELVSIASEGSVANGSAGSAAISDDGRHVLFNSGATNLVPADTNGVTDAFVRDRVLGTTSRVSVGVAGEQTDGTAYGVDISDDGRFVLIEKYRGPTDLLEGYFVVDRDSGSVQQVGWPDEALEGWGPIEPDLSGDGNHVAFTSHAIGLYPGVDYVTEDVFVWSRVTGTVTHVSDASSSTRVSGPDGYPAMSRVSISDDGSRIVWVLERAGNLQNDGVLDSDPYLWDRSAGVSQQLPMPLATSPAYEGVWNAIISGDGRWVAAEAPQPRLDHRADGSPFINEELDVMLWEIGTDSSRAVSLSSDGDKADDLSRDISLSDDGRVVTWTSGATNLVDDDTNEAFDVFAWEAPN